MPGNQGGAQRKRGIKMNDQKISMIVGMVNKTGNGSHTSGQLKMGTVTEVPVAIGDGETGTNLQLWKSYADDFDVLMITPWGRVLGPMRQINAAQEFQIGNTRIRVYYGTPRPYGSAQGIYFYFIPEKTILDSGIWTLRLVPRSIISGNYDLWMPGGQVRSIETRFLYPTMNWKEY